MLHSQAWAAGAKLHDVTRLTKPSLVQGMAISIHVPSRVYTAQRASHLFFANGDASRGQVMSIPTEPNAILDWIDDHSLGHCPLVIVYRGSKQMVTRRGGTSDFARDDPIRDAEPTVTLCELHKALRHFHRKWLSRQSAVRGESGSRDPQVGTSAWVISTPSPFSAGSKRTASAYPLSASCTLKWTVSISAASLRTMGRPVPTLYFTAFLRSALALRCRSHHVAVVDLHFAVANALALIHAHGVVGVAPVLGPLCRAPPHRDGRGGRADGRERHDV